MIVGSSCKVVEHHMKMIQLGDFVVLHFVRKDVFVD